MQLFNVSNEGELQNIKSDKAIKEHLKSDSVFLIVDDDQKRIWIWKGSTAPVRQKFISARTATQLREERGLTYKVNSEDEGDESDVFMEAIGETPKVHTEIKKAPTPQVTEISSISTAKPPVELKVEKPPTPIREQTTPITPSQVSSVKSAPAISQSHNSSAIIEKLDGIGIPHGLERELVIIGNQVYSIVEHTAKFLGKKQIKKVLEKAPMGTVPEGVFLAEDYIPRVIVDNGSVMAIEFLKQTKSIELPDENQKVSSLKDEMKFHLSDLVDFFKIEIPEEEKKKKKKN